MKKIFDISVELAVNIVENGGEISRAEETVVRICRFAGATDINVFIIPSLVSASADFAGERYTVTKRIYKNELNLGRLEETNNESRILCREEFNCERIDYSYSALLKSFCILLATGSFCIYFGGNAIDALFAGIIGIVISSIPYKNSEFNVFSKTLIESTVSAFLSFLPRLIGIDSHPDKIMIGTIMLLIPGMSIGSSMKDMMSGNLIAGILQLTEAVVIALAIALGFAAALLIFGSDFIA